VLFKKEKEEAVQMMKHYQEYEINFSDLWRYDGEVNGVMSEFKEALRKCSLEDLRKLKELL
jgi:hypothetical protein